jgi:hypothetical protein
MTKAGTEKTNQVFVPLTSFYLYDVSPIQNEEIPAKVNHTWDIPNTDIKLLQFSKRIGLSKNSNKLEFSEDVIFDGKPFVIDTIFPDRYDNLSFNSGLMFSFTQKDSNQITIFPHAFENNIRNTITFLRLFCPGNLFAPYGFIENTSILYFPDFQQNLNDGHSSLYINNVENFLLFHKKYSTLAENLRKAALANPKSVFESWYKRINNGIYFFNQTYFTSERNQVNPDAKDKNNLRLIYLCTALDALIGSGNPSGKDLAQKADLVLSNIIGAIKKDIENFYDERSRHVHANPNTMGGVTPNKTIEKFSLYIQKIILISLELSGNSDFSEALTVSDQKHWFSFYEKSGLYKQYDIKKITRLAFEAVFKNKDGYDLADSTFIDSKIKIWSQEPF